MNFSAMILTTADRRFTLRISAEEGFETAEDAFARLNEIKPILGIGAPPKRSAQPWSDAETTAIIGSATPKEAIARYREAIPVSDRTDYAITKQQKKLRKEMTCCVDEEEGGSEPEPVEIPAREIIPPVRRTMRPWTSDEDLVVSAATTPEDAIRDHRRTFGDKRTTGAIRQRWVKLNPSTTHVCMALKAMAQEPPKTGDRVRYRGKPGTITKIDPEAGGFLILLDYNAGQVWTSPETLEMMR